MEGLSVCATIKRSSGQNVDRILCPAMVLIVLLWENARHILMEVQNAFVLMVVVNTQTVMLNVPIVWEKDRYV